jgi:tetratricopeptide (TPR) repeat protein
VADSLVTAGNYFRGAIEYERVIYENDDQKIQKQALFKKAITLKMDKRFDEAINELNRLSIRNVNDTLFGAKIYQLALCLYLNENYQKAISTIEINRLMITDSHVSNELNVIKILCYNFIYNYEEAKNLISQLPQAELWLSELYPKDKLPKFKSPEKGANLSMFVPGAGQAYAGAIGEGAFNFLLNASALSFGVWQAWNGFYFTGYMVGVTMLERFYTGGKHRAAILCEQRNLKTANILNQKIMEIATIH